MVSRVSSLYLLKIFPFYCDQLPDGRVVRLGSERFGATEALFQPNLISGVDEAGLAEIIFNTLQATDIDIRAEFYKHMLLCGGTAMLPGFSDRVEREIKQLYCDRVLEGDTSKLSVRGTIIARHEQFILTAEMQSKLKLYIKGIEILSCKGLEGKRLET